MPILNYTSKIDAYKTLSEIQKILSDHGATKCIIDNDFMGNPVAITFHLQWLNQTMAYMLPCNFEGVLRAMKRNKKVPRNLCTDEQALRVGWRIIKNWIEAQMAIVDAEVAGMAEVFLPYNVMKNGKTLYKFLEQDHTLLLNNKS